MNKRLFFIVIFYCVFNTVFAQQFPVSIVSNLRSPAPVNFFNYADDSTLNSPINLQLFLNDITVSSRQIRLKVSFEGNGISFSSRDVIIGGQDLFLEGGIPLNLTNVELAPYFRLENIQGISPRLYGQTIEEGSYNFCFEVFDFLSGLKLSLKQCRNVFIFQNAPPILNMPFEGASITPSDFENIIFQWTPRQVNVSNVEYEFSIVEIWDDSVDPQTAFFSQIPIYEETTRLSTLIYGPDKPLLLEGRRYAWRVQAKALIGLEAVGLFKNQGYSEVFWFSRTRPCDLLTGISAEAKGTSKINIYWDEDTSLYTEYEIAFRESNNPEANWFNKKTNSSWATLWDLKAGTNYEYKVRGKCKYGFSEYSKISDVTTDVVTNKDANYNCGIVPDEIAISNREPHPGLTSGDEITAGDFRIVLTKIDNQSNGRVSGVGYVYIPYLKFAKFAVKYDGILVNSSSQLAEGEVVTLYDPEFGEGASLTVDVNVNISKTITGDSGQLEDVVKVDFEIKTVEIDENKAIVITGVNGETATLPGGKDVTIVSSNGDVWSVSEDGEITKQEGAKGGGATKENTNGLNNSGDTNAITATGVMVTFQSSGYYSFDLMPNNSSAVLDKEYKTLPTQSSEYRVAYKAISDNNGEDFINASVDISDAKIKKEDVIFKTKAGAKIAVQSWNGNIAKLALKRKFDYADEEILAVVKSKDTSRFDVAGSLITTHLVSNNVSPVNITIVPVGTQQVDANVEAGIKDIYAKAGVRLNIKTEPAVAIDEIISWDINNDEKLEVGDSNLLSYYTDEEKTLNNYIKQQSYYSKESYYVFVTNVTPSKLDVDGFMPLKSQFGFVFTANANTVQKQIKTIAHELGHGVFGLQHTWDEYKTPKGSTNFLMDYSDGSVLNHMDWKKIHAPGIKLYWFQEDEDGEYTNTQYIIKVLQKLRCAYANNEKIQGKDFEKVGNTFGTEYNTRFGIFNVRISDNDIFLSNDLKITSLQGGPKAKSKTYVLDFRGVTIKSGTESTLNKIKDYLFVDRNTIESEFKNYWNENLASKIDNGDSLSDRDISWLKSYASCGSEFLDVKSKYFLIKAIFNEGTSEIYEDLVLDVLENFEGNANTYSNEFITLLNTDIPFLRKLVANSNNAKWIGNEDNFTRLIKILAGLWKGSDFEDTSKYNYTYNTFSETKTFERESLEVLNYTNGTLIPKMSYKPTFTDTKIKLTSEFISNEGKVLSNFYEYDYFQPIQVRYVDNNNVLRYTNTIPAVFFAGVVSNENTRVESKRAGLTFDLVLLATGIGELSLLSKATHLSRLQNIGKVVYAGTEVLSSTVDILINYSDICDGNEDLCQTIGEYNFYLQVGLTGGEIAISKFKASRTKAKKAYQNNRLKIEKDKRDELDRHFGLIDDANGLDVAKKFKDKLFNYPNLEKRLLDNLTDDEFLKFAEDFAEADQKIIARLGATPNLTNSWKLNYQLGGNTPSIELVEFISKKFNSIENAGLDGLISARNTVDTEIRLSPDGKEHSIWSLDGEKELTNGWFTNKNELEFTVTTEYNGKKIAFGEEIRLRVFNDLGGKSKIESLISHWTGGAGGGLDTNLKEFNDAITTGNKSIEEAALSTTTGQWNKKLGYDKVEIVGQPIKRSNGQYRDIEFRFSKNLANGVDNSVEALRARELINNLKQIESKVTQDLSNLANKYGGKMKGLDLRLKSEESLARKLKTDGINTPMNDVLRYTTTFENSKFTRGVQNIINDLKIQGYEVVKIKNTFQDGVVYKGINTNVKAPDGQVFELQYHTPNSFNVKQNINHSLYKEFRLLDVNSARAIEIKQLMIGNSNSIVNPANVQTIK